MSKRERNIRALGAVAAVVIALGGWLGASAKASTPTPAGTPSVVATASPMVAEPGAPAPTERPTGLRTPPIPNDVVRTITVSGVGVVTVSPDQVVLSLGVQTQAESAAEAFTQNSEDAQAVIAALLGAGVDEENVRTVSLSLRSLYEQADVTQPVPSEASGQIIGYEASNVVQVLLEDVAAVGEVLDAAIEAGANVVHSIQFAFGDTTALLAQAREAAFADARQKAEQLAGLAGADLGAVRSMDDYSRPPVPIARAEGIGGAGGVLVQPGTEQIEVNVQVTWLLQ